MKKDKLTDAVNLIAAWAIQEALEREEHEGIDEESAEAIEEELTEVVGAHIREHARLSASVALDTLAIFATDEEEEDDEAAPVGSRFVSQVLHAADEKAAELVKNRFRGGRDEQIKDVSGEETPPKGTARRRLRFD